MIKEFDKANKQIEKIMITLSVEEEIPLCELFTPSFMGRYTNFRSFEDLLRSGGFKVESQDDFVAILGAEFDCYISSNTRFRSWRNMLNKAKRVYLSKMLII